MSKKKELSPEAARAKRIEKAQKKKAARKRNTSIAAIMGAAFSFTFVAVVIVMLYKIAMAMKDRDKPSEVSVYRGPALAVTEVTSSADDTSSEVTTTTTAPPQTVIETTTTVDPLVKIPGSITDGRTNVVVKKKVKPAANSLYDLEPLKNSINDLISGFQGDWQIYFRHTVSNKEMTIDSKPLYAASLIKLFAAGTAYQKVAEGSLDAGEADALIRPMIAESDNECFDELIDKIGFDTVTSWCRQQGYWDTVVTHQIANDEVYRINRIADTDNSTSSLDVGRFLSALYRGEIVSHEVSEKLISYMKVQTNRSKIPAGVPDGTEVANKTGETDDVDHDAAIVFCDTGDYILVVMGDTKAFGWTADDYIVQISDLVYKYLNGDPNAAKEDDEEGEETDGSSSTSDSSSETDSSSAE